MVHLRAEVASWRTVSWAKTETGSAETIEFRVECEAEQGDPPWPSWSEGVMGNMAVNALACAALSSPRTMPFLLSFALSGTDCEPPTCALHACSVRIRPVSPFATPNARRPRSQMPHTSAVRPPVFPLKTGFPTPILGERGRVCRRAQSEGKHTCRRSSHQMGGNTYVHVLTPYALSSFITPPPLVSRAPAAHAAH